MLQKQSGQFVACAGVACAGYALEWSGPCMPADVWILGLGGGLGQERWEALWATLFLAGFFPAFVLMLCLMGLVLVRARQYDWPIDVRPSFRRVGYAGAWAAVPLVVPVVILGGFFFGIITATEADAVVAGYAFLAAKLYYRNISWAQMGKIAYLPSC